MINTWYHLGYRMYAWRDDSSPGFFAWLRTQKVTRSHIQERT